MAALIKARDACSLFQNTTPAFRFGVYQFGNLTLSHQCRAMSTGRGIGKQHLHIARPRLIAIGLIGRARVSGDTAYDIQTVGLVKPAGGQPFGIVQMQADLGKIAGGPGRSTGKDHIFHAATAHRSWTVFTHHPAQRFQQVGLTTPVRTDNTRQSILDNQVCGVDKAFKAAQSKFRKPHVGCP